VRWIRSKVSRSISATGASGMMPAVFTTTSIPLNVSMACWKGRPIASSSATSPPKTVAFPPAAVMAATVSCALASFPA
jgi:hypothetical protein